MNLLSMNWIDLLLIFIIVLAMWGGWKKGFITGSINLIIWIGSLAIGFYYYKNLGKLVLSSFPSIGVWTFPVAFICIIVIVRILLSLLFSHLLNVTSDRAHKHDVNHALGLIPGFINGIIYATVVAAFLFSVPLVKSISVNTRDSKIAGNLSGNVEWLDNKLSPIFDNAIKKTLFNYTVEPGKDETVMLHFNVPDPKTRENLETKMLELVNKERIKKGLIPLKPDPELQKVGRSHARDMFNRGYFSHYTPEHKDPFDRMKASGINFLSAGENLALGQTLSICHEGLMNSPGHRANILNPVYRRLGIGILDGGVYGLMIVQEFRN